MSQAALPTSPDRDEPSVGQLVGQLAEQTSRLVHDELALAKAELKQSAKHAGIGAGPFGAAGLLALLGLATLVATAIIALALLLPWWPAALIIGVVLLLIGGVLALVGKKQVQQVSAPERTMDNVRRDVREVKEHSHGHTD